ncbi:MAG: hypothetical protein AAGF47_08130 [Planctomycetota bacterium]
MGTLGWLIGVLAVAACMAGVVRLIMSRFAATVSASGAWQIGGICAGLALGPMGAGSVWPEGYERWMVGGVAADRAADGVESRIEPEADALRASGVSAVALDEHTATLRAEADRLRREAAAERAQRSATREAAAVSAGLLALLLAARRAPVAGSSVLAGLVSGLLGGLVVAVGIRLVLGSEIGVAAAGGGVWAAGAVRPRGRFAISFGAGALAAACGLLIAGGAWAGAMVAAVVGLAWLIDWAGGRNGEHAGLSTALNARAAAVLAGLVPALLLPSASASPGWNGALLIVLAVVIAGDGLLIAATLGLKLCARRAWADRPLRAWVIATGRGVGPTMMTVLAAGCLTGRIDPAEQEGAAIVLAAAGTVLVSELSRSMTLAAVLPAYAIQTGR